MKIIKSLLLSVCLLTIASCASNEVTDSNKENTNTNTKITTATAEPEKPKEDKEEVNFSKNLKIINLEIKNELPETTSGSPFPSSMSVLVKNNDGEPVEGVSITFEYPSGKNQNEITYATSDVKTDSTGTASFKPEVPNFVTSDSIIAYPTPVNNKDKNVKAAKAKSVKSNFNVKSGYYKKAIISYVYEYDERNKPTKNFYNVIGEIRNLGGRNVGNAPINDDKLITNTPEKIIENLKSNPYIKYEKYDYMIVGTVKFSKPTAKVTDGFECTMIADVYVINLKTEQVVYKTVTEETGKGKAWGNDQTDCKTKLGKKIINDLLYTLE